MIGNDIIMRRINIIIILFIIGCAGTKGKKQVVKATLQKAEINVYSQHWNLSADSLNLFLHFELPVNHFVFRKNPEHFYSDISFTLVISDAGQNNQIYRESWNEKVTQFYYEDTRDPENYFTTERNIPLIPGDYKLFLNIQDKDSRQNWQINKEYQLERVSVLGPPLLFTNNELSFPSEESSTIKCFDRRLRELFLFLRLRVTKKEQIA